MKRYYSTLLLITAIFVFLFVFKPKQESTKMSVNWKTVNLREKSLNIEKIDELSKQINVINERIKIKDYDVFYRHAQPKDEKRHLDVLFLHGMKFKSETWLNLKTLHYVAAMGYNVTAIDLPGFGESSKVQVPEPERGEFLVQLMKTLNINPSVIISPSLSGSFTIPLIQNHPEFFKAFIPIAPIRTSLLTPEEYQNIEIPTLIICGQNDTDIGRESIANLEHIPKSQIFIIPEAGHAAYLDKPDLFHEILYNFLSLLIQK